jgi:hypothetical protein
MTHAAGTRAICAFACFYLVMGLWFIKDKSPVFDEPIHFYAGYTYLARGDFDMSRELPPLSKEIAVLPVYALARLRVIRPPNFMLATENTEAGLDLLARSPLSAATMLALGRVPMLIIGVLTVLLAARWASGLWGMPAAVVAAGLAATEPTLIAHGSLVTPDIALTFFFALTFYLAWAYREEPSLLRFVLAGIALGAALGSKFSAFVALPALAAIVVADAASGAWVVPWRHRLPGTGWRHSCFEGALFLTGLCIIAALTLVCIYAVHGIGAWRDGLADQLHHAAQGHMAYLWGRYATHGWWYYFPLAFALKTPILTLAAIVAAVALPYVGAPFRRPDALFLGVPALFLLLAMMWGGINIGIRYILPVYPFVLVAASRIATFAPRRAALMPALLSAILAWNVAATLRLAPHFLAAGNAIAGGPLGIPRFLSDSNVDWGQDLIGLKRYMDHEGIPSLYLAYFGNFRPADYGIEFQNVPSFGPGDIGHVATASATDLLAISVTNLYGVYLADHDLYAWLRAKTPIATIGYSIYVYDLADDRASHCRLADAYAATGAEAPYEALERRKCVRS